MTIQVEKLVDLPGFERVHFTLSLLRNDMDEALMEELRESGLDDNSSAIAAALPALISAIGYTHHFHGKSLFPSLLDSILEEEMAFGAKGIDWDKAVELRATFEQELLARCTPNPRLEGQSQQAGAAR
ncbi:hypothetical protein [Loktanella sp. SALINAS62]|uniref:hypothetical protein n=1 Tax=Loktanella sp. SALINAS62 TaxID=2706124 RepID=UPI001B8AE4C7|nr:hypothetical protein [Loktanella sp. SALINAS62]MBS1301702.1 hypothetical protein [Loktanella sp. SALINAS62]